MLGFVGRGKPLVVLGKYPETANVPQNLDGTFRADVVIRIRRERMPQNVLFELHAGGSLYPAENGFGRGRNCFGWAAFLEGFKPSPDVVGRLNYAGGVCFRDGRGDGDFFCLKIDRRNGENVFDVGTNFVRTDSAERHKRDSRLPNAWSCIEELRGVFDG